MKATFEKGDYLCIGPNAWGRSKTLREEVRACRANAYTPKRKEPYQFVAWRLSDQTDRLIFDGMGGFSYDAGKIFKVWRGTDKTKINIIPENLIDEIEKENEE